MHSSTVSTVIKIRDMNNVGHKNHQNFCIACLAISLVSHLLRGCHNNKKHVNVHYYCHDYACKDVYVMEVAETDSMIMLMSYILMRLCRFCSCLCIMLIFFLLDTLHELQWAGEIIHTAAWTKRKQSRYLVQKGTCSQPASCLNGNLNSFVSISIYF